MKETDDKIVIFGDHNYRFDVPKSKIKEVGRNVILNIDFPELASIYKIDRNAPLPTGEHIEKINDEAYPESHSKGIKGGEEIGRSTNIVNIKKQLKSLCQFIENGKKRIRKMTIIRSIIHPNQ